MHDTIRDNLAVLLERRFPLPTHSVVKEYVLGVDPETQREVRVDIVVMQGDRYVHIIDVSIVNPTASCYLTYHQPSNLVTESAARHREQAKRRYHSRVVGDPNTMIPFVLEITGRFGPTAKEYMKEWCGVNNRLRSEFLSEISYVLAKGVGRIMRNSEKQLVSG